MFLFSLYTPLSDENPLSNALQSGNNIDNLFNNIFLWGIAIAVIAAIVSLAYAGFQYMLSDLVSNKKASTDRMQATALGLALALGAWAILNTINPAILKSSLNFDALKVDLRSDQQKNQDIINDRLDNNERELQKEFLEQNFNTPMSEMTELYDRELDRVNRNVFIEQLRNDPEMMDTLIRLGSAEVGSYGHTAIVAFYETVMNRASMRNPASPQNLKNLLTSDYYAPMKDGGIPRFNNPGTEKYEESFAALQEALTGTNYARGRTHNTIITSKDGKSDESGVSETHVQNKWKGDPFSFIKIGQETYYSKVTEPIVPWYK
jgi:ABC-type nickel/cobalt efflux system permease component RcnA